MYKVLLWASHKEDLYQKALSSSPYVDCYYYEKLNQYALLNNVDVKIKTTFYDINGKAQEVEIEPHQIKWF